MQKTTASLGLHFHVRIMIHFSKSVFRKVIALRVLFFRMKQSLTRPSHSVKLIGGGGYLGSILTTLDSTLGGGLKLFFDTLCIKAKK